jgi:hypothetical protein
MARRVAMIEYMRIVRVFCFHSDVIDWLIDGFLLYIDGLTLDFY